MIKIYHSKKYLIEQLKSKNYIQIAKENNVSSDTIQHHMNKHGLTKKPIPWTEEEIKLLKENYGVNPNVYKLFTNRTISSINHKASRLRLPKIVRKRRYNVNHNFFKEWTPEMAYVLGWFFSDGNVSHKKEDISIHLNQKDHYILEKISGLMGSNRPISTFSNSSYLRINSKILANDLIGIGCIPRKSLTLKFPDIKYEFLPHFIRGYFDGDGSIHFNKPNTIKITFISTKKFLLDLQKSLNDILNVKIGPLQSHHKMWIALYYGDDARKICNWMYKNSKDLYLRRKRDRFDRHIELRENGRI